MRLGIAHHLGWAVAVTADDDHRVVDRRRIELIEPGLPPAPVHHEGGPHALHRQGDPLDDLALASLVAEVRASVVRATATALDELVAAVPGPLTAVSLRAWPADFPTDVATQRRVPHESRADSVMYLQVLAALAGRRGWDVLRYEARDVEAAAAAPPRPEGRGGAARPPGHPRPAMGQGPPPGPGRHHRRHLTRARRRRADRLDGRARVGGIASVPGW